MNFMKSIVHTGTCFLSFIQPIKSRKFTNLQAAGKTVLLDYKVEWHVSIIITFVGLIGKFFFPKHLASDLDHSV